MVEKMPSQIRRGVASVDRQLLGVLEVQQTLAVEQCKQPLTLLIPPKFRMPIPFPILISMPGAHNPFLTLLAS